ncbi:hypothetical protein ACQP00_42575 [Dactylosporangium sp. CS-047395]|uniref:hypothetical protein n=1 Tax=Dactylosporangium sp. CS-047395 TaxID=3239936 RepID=UPI003D939BF4
MNRQRHFPWCDLTRCSAGRHSSPYYKHRSREFTGTFDPDSDNSVNLSVAHFANRTTLFLLEFCNDRCEGHEITPRQARELYDALGEYLGEVEAADAESGNVARPLSLVAHNTKQP